jgi:hypothetical protein
MRRARIHRVPAKFAAASGALSVALLPANDPCDECVCAVRSRVLVRSCASPCGSIHLSMVGWSAPPVQPKHNSNLGVALRTTSKTWQTQRDRHRPTHLPTHRPTHALCTCMLVRMVRTGSHARTLLLCSPAAQESIAGHVVVFESLQLCTRA